MVPLAMPLLQLLARLRTLRNADPAALRDRTAAALQSFEARALAAGNPADLVRRAHYALCDSLDEAVLQTPWGATETAAETWRRNGMVASFHPAIGSGRFLDALRRAESKAAALRPALEIMLLCLSFGAPAGARRQPGVAAEAEALRRSVTAALLTGLPPAPPALSASTAGVAAPFRRNRARLPLWVAAVAAAAIGGGAFLLLDARVNEAGDTAFARLLAAPPARMPRLEREAVPPPPPPPTAEPAATDRVRARLAAEEAASTLAVAGSAAIPVLRFPADALFGPAGATLVPTTVPLLDAVAAAVRPETGVRLRVLGYADDRSPRSVAFPSAHRLTAARAEAVRAALATRLGTAVPVTAEGRAGADPLAPNASPEGRARNRRIELVLDGAPP